MLLGRGIDNESDIICNIMDKKSLKEIKDQLKQMYKSPQNRKAKDFISIAEKLGRKKFIRGKEPTYIRDDSPVLCPPLSIPNHPGDMPIGTARSIINALLTDADVWGIFLMEKEDE